MLSNSFKFSSPYLKMNFFHLVNTFVGLLKNLPCFLEGCRGRDLFKIDFIYVLIDEEECCLYPSSSNLARYHVAPPAVSNHVEAQYSLFRPPPKHLTIWVEPSFEYFNFHNSPPWGMILEVAYHSSSPSDFDTKLIKKKS